MFPAAPDEHATLDLLGRIEDGDDTAWNELYERYHDPLLFAVRVHLGANLRRHLESVDVLQSVALEAFRSLRRFEYRGPGSLNRYLRQLVLNKIRDRADTFGAQKRDSGPLAGGERLADVADPASEPAYRDPATYDRLERALAALPESMREILVLRKVDGLGSREVAERTGKSDAAVRKEYSRALARLTTLMTAG